MILAACDTIRDSLVKDFFFLASSTIQCHFVNRFAGSMSLPVFPDSGSLLATPPFPPTGPSEPGSPALTGTMKAARERAVATDQHNALSGPIGCAGSTGCASMLLGLFARREDPHEASSYRGGSWCFDCGGLGRDDTAQRIRSAGQEFRYYLDRYRRRRGHLDGDAGRRLIPDRHRLSGCRSRCEAHFCCSSKGGLEQNRPRSH